MIGGQIDRVMEYAHVCIVHTKEKTHREKPLREEHAQVGLYKLLGYIHVQMG